MNNRKYAFFVALAIIIIMSIGAESTGVDAIKPYTIMIYMNGSDLESDFGLATDDLAEMLDSGLKSRNANVIILTGGTYRWMNDAIPEYECIIWELADGWLNEIESMGKVDMGNPATLRDFIKFGLTNYPAEKFGLIMWDHGGGSIAGFGHDENFNDSSLSLADMQQAFEEAGLREQKFEFLGFDACLMATVEMAVLASDYAKVLIASEDLEPGEGWDYHFLSALNKKPRMSGVELGKIIVDTFIDFFGEDSDEILTLSVVDLARVGPVMAAMGELMAMASEEIEIEFHTLAHRRAITKTFGEGSPRDNYADMVDIGDMALQLYDLFPQEAEAVLQALENCVVYNRHNSDIDLWGLSTFYIYGGKSQGVPSMATYTALDMDKNYTAYLHEFFQYLKLGQPAPVIHTELALWQPVRKNTHRMVGLLQTDDTSTNLLWPKINGHPVVLFPIVTTANARKYAIPASINAREVDIIVSFSNCNPQGRIIGSRNIGENVFQKGFDPILTGDKITIYYTEYDFASNTEPWARGDVFTVRNSLQLTWAPPPANHRAGLRFTDARKNITYGNTLPAAR